MLKKHNKLIMLLVLVTFMFTMVGSAGAASFSDVTGTSVESGAIYQLNGLGILDGYPDGTFGPEKTITRAEFAKIACVTAGLKSVASGMGGTASPFSDVATDYWGNGWINVAAAQGFVKGDPAGTFRPEAQITQAEAITVLMRILGYNDNLEGNWPSDYIAKAANLGVLDDVTFGADQAATRGIIAILAAATLDEGIVEYKASDNIFSFTTTPVTTLLADKFSDAAKTEDALIMSFTVNSDKELSINYYTYDEDFTTLSAMKTLKVADNCAFSGGSILDCVEVMGDIIVNDDNEAISITVKNYKKIGPKTAAGTAMNELKIDGNKVSIDGTDYSFVSGKIAVEAFEGANGKTTVDPTTIADTTYKTSDAYAVIMNDDDKVVALRAWTFPTTGIVESVSGDRITYIEDAEPAKSLAGSKVIASNGGLWSGFDNTSNFEDEDIYVQRNGKPATLADIQPMDTVSVLKDYRGTDYYLVVTGMKITGKLQSAKYAGTAVEKVKVMDMWWKLPYSDITRATYKAFYSIDNGVTIEGNIAASTLDSEYDVWNTDVSLLMGPTGKPAGIFFGDTAASSKMYGVITDVTSDMAWTDGTTVKNIKLMKSDEEEYSYPISEDTYIKDATYPVSTKIKDGYTMAGITNVLKTTTPQLVTVSLKSSGLVDRIEILNQADITITAATLDDDNKLVYTDKWVDATDVVVFNLNNGTGGALTATGDLDETKVVGWNELKDLLSTGTDKIAAYYVNSNNELVYAVVNAGAVMTGGSKYAIFKEKFSDADNWVQLIGQDAYTEGTVIAGLTKGDVVRYTLSGTEVNIPSKAIAYGTKSSITVSDISGQTIELSNSDSFKTDEDTVYMDNSDDTDLKVLEKVAVGDAVIVIPDSTDSDLAAAVVVVEYSGSATSSIASYTGSASAAATQALLGATPNLVGLNVTAYSALPAANKLNVATAVYNNRAADTTKAAIQARLDAAVANEVATLVAAYTGSASGAATKVLLDANALGLNVTAYNALTNKLAVATILYNNCTTDTTKALIQERLNTAVTAQAAAENEATQLAAYNAAADGPAIATLLSANVMGLTVTNYSALTTTPKTAAAAALFAARPAAPGWANKGALQTALDTAVNAQLTTLINAYDSAADAAAVKTLLDASPNALGLNVTAYSALTATEKTNVAAALFAVADLSTKAKIQTALDAKVTDEIAAQIAVFTSAAKNAIYTALSTNALGLDLTAYNALTPLKQLAVCEYMEKISVTFTTKANIQSAIAGGIATL